MGSYYITVIQFVPQMFEEQSSELTFPYQMNGKSCCIRPSPGRERIMDVVPGMDGVRNLGIRRGAGQAAHTCK
jgi:hypothetical protein